MKYNTSLLTALALGLGVAGFAASGFADDMGTAGAMNHPTPPATQPTSAVDVGNKVCPVSGDEVGDSKLTETYDGKTYHFCCDGCPQKFNKDPEKYIKAMNADPAKYGIKPSK